MSGLGQSSSDIAPGQYINEADGDLLCLNRRGAPAGELEDKIGQALDRVTLGQPRKPTSLLPRIETELGECRDRA